jgi:hypothetical protein
MVKKSVFSPKCTKFLLDIKSCILQEPTQFDMDTWIDNTPHSSCGSTACIIGWGAYLIQPTRFCKKTDAEQYYLCGEVIKITFPEMYSNIFRLAYLDRWPEKFQLAWKEAKTPKERAKVAAKRIDWFIQKGE